MKKVKVGFNAKHNLNDQITAFCEIHTQIQEYTSGFVTFVLNLSINTKIYLKSFFAGKKLQNSYQNQGLLMKLFGLNR